MRKRTKFAVSSKTVRILKKPLKDIFLKIKFGIIQKSVFQTTLSHYEYSLRTIFSFFIFIQLRNFGLIWKSERKTIFSFSDIFCVAKGRIYIANVVSKLVSLYKWEKLLSIFHYNLDPFLKCWKVSPNKTRVMVKKFQLRINCSQCSHFPDWQVLLSCIFFIGLSHSLFQKLQFSFTAFS